MEASLSLSDDARHGVAARPQEVSIWDPLGEPPLPDRACEAAFPSESLPFLTPVCICVWWKLADGSLVHTRQRVGKPRWPWKSTFAWPAYGRPEIKVIALGLSNRHHGQQGACGFLCFASFASGGSSQSSSGLPPRGLI